LVEAFRSTLEEVSRADVVVHVVDGSDPDPESQVAAVREVFGEIGALSLPEILVVNKIDAADPQTLDRLRRVLPEAVYVSSLTGAGIEALLGVIEQRLPRPSVEVDVLVPYDRGDLVSRVYDDGEIVGQEHTGEGTRLRARVTSALAADLLPYVTA
jgi:GTP-binding protein HflX